MRSDTLAVDLRQLRYFLAIVDAGSLSRAAQGLRMAQSGLSTQMSQIESELGCRLLHRTPAGVQVTEQGAALYAHAQQIVKAADDLRNVVRRAAADPRGTVTVGLPQGDADPYAMDLFAEVRKRHPGVRLEIFEEISGNLPRGLHGGKLDMALLVNDADTQGLHATQVVDEELYLIAPADHVFGKFVRLDDLASMRFAMPTAAHGCRAIVEAAMSGAGRKFPEPEISANSSSVLLRSVATGWACSIMPWDCAAEWVERGQVVAIPIWPALTRRVYVCTSKETPLSPAARCVKELLVEVTKARVSLR